MQSSQSGEMRVTLVFVGLDMPFGPWVWHSGQKAGGQLRLSVDICSSAVCVDDICNHSNESDYPRRAAEREDG